jgi:hypothetical protein
MPVAEKVKAESVPLDTKKLCSVLYHSKVPSTTHGLPLQGPFTSVCA